MILMTPAPVSTDDVTARIFLSWAHDDHREKDSLLGDLMKELKVLAGVRFDWWEDSHLDLGEHWRRGILARLEECDYGLQLLSPCFFASDFIARHEIPPFVGPEPRKRALPVGLRPFALDGSARTHGVEALQVFLLDGKFFSQLTTRVAKQRFARELAQRIRRRLLDLDTWQPL